MNKERRKEIASVIKGLHTELENVAVIRVDLINIQSSVKRLYSEESRVLDSLEERWSETSRYESCEEACDKLSDATDDMKSLLKTLQKFEDEINGIIDELNDTTFC